jgi:hypothetical protein
MQANVLNIISYLEIEEQIHTLLTEMLRAHWSHVPVPETKKIIM